ncbi:MAG: glycosyl transferase group 1 [Myxococcaceae bacterium]|nr:glycosyl transferase group 1 [Myxococcaceae bacterium]
MRITFVVAGGFNLSGGDRVISIYAERLQKRGHKLFVITPPYPPPTLAEQARSILRGRGVIPQHVHGPSHFTNSPVPHVRLDRYRPIVDSDLPDADVVISTWWETAEWVAKLSPEKGAKACFLQHFEAFDYLPKKRVEATWRLPLHKITISNWLVDLARDKFGDSDVSLVYNSVDTQQFHAPERTRNAEPVVGMLYNHAPWKGVPVSVAALDEVRKEFPNLRLVTFGATEVKPMTPLPDYATHHVSPAQDKIKDLYAQCDVWLCGSTSEGFHLPPLEAMACRCPVVSTKVGGPLDVVRDGVNGYLVPVDDQAGLADRLKKVLRLAPDAWRKMSDAAYATATHYTWDDATDLFEAALLRTIERRELGLLGPTTPIGKLLAKVGR